MPLYFRSAATDEPAHAAAEEQPQDRQESLEVELLDVSSAIVVDSVAVHLR